MSARLDATLAALAEPTRRRVIESLRCGPRSAGELARAAGTSAPTMSRHLGVLRAGGLVDEERDDRDARRRIFRLRRAPFRELGDWIADVERHWGIQLDAFRRHVAARGPRSPR